MSLFPHYYQGSWKFFVLNNAFQYELLIHNTVRKYLECYQVIAHWFTLLVLGKIQNLKKNIYWDMLIFNLLAF